jgi:Kef-type K+ transport system membrane component KefB
MNNVSVLFFDIAVIAVIAAGLGALAARLGQPPVVGEILTGILIGPTVLDGRVAAFLFPADVRPLFVPLANLGVALFMFLVGLEIDGERLRGARRGAVGVALGSLLVPFGLGVALAVLLPGGHGVAFVLFLGVAMGATAFPVLARILVDRDLQRTRLGGLALAAAAICDVLAWSVLAVIVSLHGGGAGSWRLLAAIPYAAVMLLVVRPLLRRLADRGVLGDGRLVVIVIGVMASGGLTEWMNLHFIFGAFLFGLLVPRGREGGLRAAIEMRVGSVARLLLPVYFLMAGLNVDLGGVDLGGLAVLGLLLLVAAGGKLLGVYPMARLHRVPPREAVALAALMNTRGLTELVILTTGYQLGVIGRDLYSLMVVVAVVTTVMTGPLLRLMPPPGAPRSESPAAAVGRST